MTEEKKWHEISSDELQHRIMVQKNERTIPVSNTVKKFEEEVDKFLKTLGVNIDLEDSIGYQMEQLGIVRWENIDPRTPQLWGWFFFIMRKPSIILLDNELDLEPVGWVSAPIMKKDGSAYCKVEDWRRGTLKESDGVKIVK